MTLRVLLEAVDEHQHEAITWRRYLHQHPELSFHEHETAQYIENLLSSFGGFIITRPTPTSVLARLIGEQPGNTIAVRADIDALPIIEDTNLAFSSKSDGVMHACGHDGHTAIVLGVAKLFSQYIKKEQLCGEIRFIFQHAEELPPGGADEMIAAGVMDQVDWVIGAHLQSPVPVGKVGVVSGPMLASPDTFNITIHGKGGHAAEPHKTVDSIAIGAQIVTNLQHIVSRMTNPMDPLVISVTQFLGGHTHNVIPGSVQLTGTVRCMDPEIRENVPEQMEQIIKGLTFAYGAEYEFKYLHGYRPLINNEKVSQIVADTIIELFGEEALYTIKPSMSADDFSAYLYQAPGTYFNIGAGNTTAGIVHPHHHPKFDIDEAAIAIGMKVFIAAIEKLQALQPA